jgi:Omp85 superfamily domain
MQLSEPHCSFQFQFCRFHISVDNCLQTRAFCQITWAVLYIDADKSVVDHFKSLVPSTSVGVGIAARFTCFRVELNYCFPVVASSTDGIKAGVQFGIGAEFM